MPKELGMIHTVNDSFPIPGLADTLTPYDVGIFDTAGLLTEQLQRMVRQGNFFKVVGIDISLSMNSQAGHSGVLSGTLRYYNPTRGRCSAFRGAFKAMAEQMANQGISMRENQMYDFRPAITNQLPTANPNFGKMVIKNQATLDGSEGLCLNHQDEAGASVFGVHNASVQPQYLGNTTELFDEGFNTLLASGGSRTDFVLNEAIPYSGNADFASLDYEEIPWQLAISGTADERATATFQFRPDPALYIAVMTGQFVVRVEDYVADTGISPSDLVAINIAVQCAGWKSIMGNPDKGSNKRKGRK